MLFLTVKGREFLNEETMEIIDAPTQILKLEHSLLSISTWESIWHKPYFSEKDKTAEELLSYIKCMTINRNQVNPIVFQCLTKEHIMKIKDYIDNPMTATTFSKRVDEQKPMKKEIITAEIIYYWMISAQIPLECEKWHINRLMTLIKVFGIKNAPKKKIGKGQLTKRNAAMNAANRKRMRSKG